jgi:hypothetical protein
MVNPPEKHSQHIGKEEEGQQVEDDDQHDRRDSFSDIGSEPEIQTAVPVMARARVVEVAKRPPPILPPRNPERVISPPPEVQAAADGFDKISLNDEDDKRYNTDHVALSGSARKYSDSSIPAMVVTPSDERETNIPGSFQ